MSTEQARADQKAYVAAMVADKLHAAIAIEKRYGLFGYSPEIVSVGLAAACDGKDVQAAVDAYLEGDAS